VKRTIRIGTRGSQLALVQSRWVQACVQRQLAEYAVELVTITTSGDRFVEQPLSLIGGKGLFVKEIEEALQSRVIDCAVHSMKDVPGELAPGLVLAAIPPREDVRDVLITPDGARLDQLPPGARVGTSSLRRMALVRAARADLEVVNLRGNVDTRLRKLDRGDFGAVILAAAGLNRLGIKRSGLAYCDPTDFVPAVGQGALAIESRADETADLLAGLDDAMTRTAVTAERAFLARAGGSCRTPLAAHATISNHTIELRALFASPDGRQVVRGERRGKATDGEALGVALAEELLGKGGAEILRALQAS
jgi:hydroxymethylbilane synthase